MRAKVDHATILQNQFDSSALTPLRTVIHRVEEPGLYQGEILSGGQVIGRFSVQAGLKEAHSQVNIDLAAIRRMQRESFQVQAPGAVVFFVSRGTEGLADGCGEQIPGLRTSYSTAETSAKRMSSRPRCYSLERTRWRCRGAASDSAFRCRQRHVASSSLTSRLSPNSCGKPVNRPVRLAR